MVGEFDTERLEMTIESNEKKSKYPKITTTFIDIIIERKLPVPELNLTRNEVSDNHLVISVDDAATDELGVRSSNANSFPNRFRILDPVELR